MKRFMYASFGILALAVAFHLGAMTAEGPRDAIAGWVEANGCGAVSFDEEGWVLDELGQVWSLTSSGWTRFLNLDPPVPIDQVKFWAHGRLITTSNEYFQRQGIPSQWASLGYWPGSPSPAEKTTWSKLKSEFK